MSIWKEGTKVKKWKSLIALLLALVMVLGLVACGNTTSQESADPSEAQSAANDVGAVVGGDKDDVGSELDDYDGDKTITIGITGDPAWGPWASFTPGRRNTAGMIYQTLLSQVTDPDTGEVTIYYVMMSGYEKVDDNTYRVYLRDGIYDTNGNSFTASDAKFSLEKAKESQKVSGMNDMLECNIVNDLTIDIVMGATMAVGDFEELLTAPNMVTQASYEASPDEMLTTPVGTTGYVLTEYTAGATCTISKADLPYWNEDATTLEDGYCFIYETGKVDTVNFKVITDTSTMAIALETGDIDIASSVATTDLDLFRSDDYSLANIPDNVMYTVYNCSEDSVMSNLNLRLAFAYAFDSEDCLDASYDGDGLVATAWGYKGTIGWQSAWDDPNWDYFGYDPDKAAQYLQAYYDETGTSAKDLHINLLVTTTSTHVKIAEVLQASINALVGTECCELLQYETNSYNELMDDPTAWDVLLYYGMANKPYVLYNWNQTMNAARKTSGLATIKIYDQTLQDLIEAAIGEDTFSDETVTAFHDYVMEQCYAVGICTGYTHWAAASWVKSFAVGPKSCVVPNAMTYDWLARDNA